jgi:hypothetical protein
MNKNIFSVLGLICFIAVNTSFADVLSPQEIIPKFYILLNQDVAPSASDEKAFFGEEDTGIKALILTRDKTANPTIPIWNYLRTHKDLFFTVGANNINNVNFLISDPYKLFRIQKGIRATKPFGSVSKDQERVSVFYPAKQLGPHQFSDLTGITFILGEKAYLKIGATLIPHPNQQMLYEIVYRELTGIGK